MYGEAVRYNAKSCRDGWSERSSSCNIRGTENCRGPGPHWDSLDSCATALELVRKTPPRPQLKLTRDPCTHFVLGNNEIPSDRNRNAVCEMFIGHRRIISLGLGVEDSCRRVGHLSSKKFSNGKAKQMHQSEEGSSDREQDDRQRRDKLKMNHDGQKSSSRKKMRAMSMAIQRPARDSKALVFVFEGKSNGTVEKEPVAPEHGTGKCLKLGFVLARARCIVLNTKARLPGPNWQAGSNQDGASKTF
ncbi:hypothetical protein DFH08DRAFT_805396 [Mycena albidolilacea]|uniref:Uncharacterized protein n=1 Tax=Mycena albidolilacea TaxID=1033008 RepID=A0AAD7A9H6_9AGAR|nr:hypothetical protein DFH08DRAFT_805396 [Mycena albidolilacea]